MPTTFVATVLPSLETVISAYAPSMLSPLEPYSRLLRRGVLLRNLGLHRDTPVIVLDGLELGVALLLPCASLFGHDKLLADLVEPPGTVGTLIVGRNGGAKLAISAADETDVVRGTAHLLLGQDNMCALLALVILIPGELVTFNLVLGHDRLEAVLYQGLDQAFLVVEIRIDAAVLAHAIAPKVSGSQARHSLTSRPKLLKSQSSLAIRTTGLVLPITSGATAARVITFLMMTSAIPGTSSNFWRNASQRSLSVPYSTSRSPIKRSASCDLLSSNWNTPRTYLQRPCT